MTPRWLAVAAFPVLGLLPIRGLPSFSFQPRDTTVEAGGSATLFIRYPRGTSPDVQWRLNGKNLPGQNGQDLVINDADFSNVGVYTAVLTDADGSVTSDEAMLNLLGLIDPPFDPALKLHSSEGQLSGRWIGDGILEKADAPNGPWTTIEAAKSNTSLPSPDTPRYYRLQNPYHRPTTVFIPTSYDPDEPMPLLIALHGYTDNPAGITGYFGLEAMAESRGFLFCAPPGMREETEHGKTFWNATQACCNFYGSGVDDVTYLTGVIMEIQKQWNVDPKRIHLTGHSNGAAMAYRMALEEAALIASIASVAGITEYDPLRWQPVEPVSILQIHGTEDELISYDGGLIVDPGGRLPVDQLRHPSAFETIEIWAAYNGCEGPSTEAAPSLDLDLNVPGLDTRVTRYVTHPAGGAVELWTIEGGAHGPRFQNGTTSSQFSEKLIDWLLAHPKP